VSHDLVIGPKVTTYLEYPTPICLFNCYGAVMGRILMKILSWATFVENFPSPKNDVLGG